MPVRPGPGRPPKFGRPSRAVTLTLPEDVLERLGAVHADLAQAIVNLVEGRPRSRARRRQSAELCTYGKHAVIVVTPVKALKRLAGVQLVPIGDGHALISLESPLSIAQLELALLDAQGGEEVGGAERQTLQVIADILRSARLSRSTKLTERTIIVLESMRDRRTAPSEHVAAVKRRVRKRGAAA